MAKRALMAVLVVVGLTACQDTEWYRVEATAGGWIIARVDFAEDTCTIMHVVARPAGGDDDPVSGVDVRLEHREHAHVGWVREVPGDIDRCTTDYVDGEALTGKASGSVRFKDVSLVDGNVVACRVKVNAKVGDTRFKQRLNIWASGCPTPTDGDTHVVNSVRAEASPYYYSTPSLVLVGTTKNGSCARFEFNPFADEAVPGLPPDWSFFNAYLWRPQDGQTCDPNIDYGYMWHAPHVATYEGGSGRLSFGKMGTVSFNGDDYDFPCHVSVNYGVELGEQYHWVPWQLRLEASDVVVEGVVCE
jgi:hypothetical protein